MQTKGKFYIWLNIPSNKTCCWNQEKQYWMLIPSEATFFDDEEDAIKESIRASIGGHETVVYQATKDI